MNDAVPRTENEDALTRRQRVLDLSGWGQPFRLWQPHNYCFWVLLAFFVFGLMAIVSLWGRSAGEFSGALSSAVIALTLYGLVFLAILRWTDHYERQPRKLIAVAFLYGAIVASTWLALTVNTAMLEIYPKLFGQAFAADWSAALTAPFTEETSKALGFVLLIGLAPRLIRSPYDGVFIGAFIGLGFQLSEDVLYSYNSAVTSFGVDQSAASLQTFAIRAGSGIFSHTLFSALFCCGLIFAIGTPIQQRRLGLGVGLMLLAMFAHSTWDAASAVGGGTPLGVVFAVVIGLVALFALIVALRKTVPQERKFLRGIMQPEVENGTITEAELDALCAPKKERKQFVRSGKGHKSHRNAKHVLRAANDLGHEIAKAQGGNSPGVQHERAEITRLRARAAQ